MIAIELFLDPATDRAVRAVSADLERAAIGSLGSRSRVPQHPHVTLAVIDAVSPELTGRLVEGLPALPAIHLDAVGTFRGRSGVVFLAVRLTPGLAEFHRVLHELVDEYGPRQIDQLRPGRLVPHCTVVERLAEEQIGPAVAIARRRLPISGTAASINAVAVGSGEVSPVR